MKDNPDLVSGYLLRSGLEMRSVQVRPGSCVTMFKDKNYSGRSRTYCSNTTDVGSYWEEIYSMKIAKGKKEECFSISAKKYD